MTQIGKKSKVGRPRKKEDEKHVDPLFGIRLEQEVKDFYLSYKGLAKRVLMDFYNKVDMIKHKDMLENKKSE